MKLYAPKVKRINYLLQKIRRLYYKPIKLPVTFENAGNAGQVLTIVGNRPKWITPEELQDADVHS